VDEIVVDGIYSSQDSCSTAMDHISLINAPDGRSAGTRDRYAALKLSLYTLK
jgi:hypothetical protein